MILGADAAAAGSTPRQPVVQAAYTGNAASGERHSAGKAASSLDDVGIADDGSGAKAPSGDTAPGKSGADAPAPDLPVMRDLSKLPEPVRQMRQKIEDAARSGDIEKLRPLLGKGNTATQLAISGHEGDPIDYLKSLSGDDAGREILAILLDVLDTGYVEMDQGTANETYVWPYFFARRLDKLTPAQTVELLRLVTAGDLDEMQSMGHYSFFRVGIAPDGTWSFFVAGD